MQIGRIQGATRTIGKSQGYIGLPIRDENIIDDTNGQLVPTMSTAWIPDPEEIDMLKSGGTIILRLFGTQHPPVMIGVLPSADPVIDTSPANELKDRLDTLNEGASKGVWGQFNQLQGPFCEAAKQSGISVFNQDTSHDMSAVVVSENEPPKRKRISTFKHSDDAAFAEALVNAYRSGQLIVKPEPSDLQKSAADILEKASKDFLKNTSNQ